jgi:hypothetical protein
MVCLGTAEVVVIDYFFILRRGRPRDYFPACSPSL